MEYLPTFTLVHGHVSPNVGKSSIHFSHLGLHFPKHIQGLVPLQMLERFFFQITLRELNGLVEIHMYDGWQETSVATPFFLGGIPRSKKKTEEPSIFLMILRMIISL